jgi:alanyl-tRNA synthetase
MSIDLESPEAKAAIKAAVEEATAALAAKNKELLGELKEARKGKTINPEDVEKLESRIEELTGQLTEAQKTAKKASTEAETAKKALADAEGFTQRLLVDNGLTDALTKAGVSNPVHLKAAKALLNGQVQIVADGDTKVAKVGDKALTDFIGEWAKGDEGKFFVAAPNNSGGGATGGSGGNVGQTKGDLGGDRSARVAALQERFPELKPS